MLKFLHYCAVCDKRCSHELSYRSIGRLVPEYTRCALIIIFFFCCRQFDGSDNLLSEDMCKHQVSSLPAVYLFIYLATYFCAGATHTSESIPASDKKFINIMAGRKSVIPLHDQKRVISKYGYVFDNFKTCPPINHDVYESIQNELNEMFQHKMSKMAIQASVRRNKKYFFHDNNNSDGLTNNTTDVTNNITDLDNNINFEKTDNCDNYSDLEIEFQMDIYEFKRIAPKNHTLLQNSWTNELQDQIWKKTELDCTFAFKNCYVPTNFQLNDIVCKGKCTQCGANIVMYLNPLTENFVNVVCQVNRFEKNFVHDKNVKNRLTSNRKRKIAERLMNYKALKVRTLMADELMDKDNPKEPPTMPKLNNLRKIRHEAKRALQFDKNTIISIYAMSQSSPFNTYIHNFSLVPFFVYFWTNEQSKYYDEILKNTHTVLSLDATGSIFQTIAPPGVSAKDAKHTFLYVVMAYTTSTSIPLCYMASQSHTTECIATWLSTWAVNRHLPKEIICDDSAALLKAICRTFLKTDTNVYLAQCFSLLEGQVEHVPVCYVRLDKSHFFKKLPKQSCFDKCSEKCKYFYINCIKVIYGQHCYKEIKKIIDDIVTVSLPEYISPGKYEEALQRLSTKISKISKNDHIKIDDDIDNHFQEENILPENDTLPENYEADSTICPLIKYYNDVIETEKLYLLLFDVKYQQQNEYYLPAVNETLKRLLRKLPMWGNVMTNYFVDAKDVPSSSNVESHFKDLKTIYFNTKDERIRLDEFLIQHYTFINGTVKLSISQTTESQTTEEKINKVQIKKSNKDLINRKESQKQIDKIENVTSNIDFGLESIFQDKPVEVENWRGLAVPHNKANYNLRPIYILQNGNIAISKNKKLILTNTCAFDAISQTFAIAYKDRLVFRQEINNCVDAFTKFIADLATAKRFNQKLYDTRDILLSSIFCPGIEINDETRCNVINCACNVTKILEEICTSYFSATRKRTCSNENCTNHENKTHFECKYLPLNINIINQKGITKLQEAVESGMKDDLPPLCYCCKKGTVSFNYNLNSLIMFEIHDIRILFNDVPVNIEINERFYEILSIIEFDPPLSSEGIGHYKAHCFRKHNRTFQCYDDMYTKIQKNKTEIMPHAIIYTLQSDDI